jgi:putative flavoprotein involved in K+ transport
MGVLVMNVTEIPVAIVGGGQAGLSLSYFLRESGVEHLVFEKNAAMHAWKTQRWDTFCLVTPNWQCQLPGHPYAGDDPEGFMVREEIIAYLEDFRKKVGAPLREGVAVRKITQRSDGRFDILASDGAYVADQVVAASGGYDTPIIPALARKLPDTILQLHSQQYRNPQSLPAGAVLVVGAGQSGAQIAEDLHLAGRQVHLAVGGAPRCARFYRGRDVVRWLAEMGYYDIAVEKHPLKEGVRDNTNHYVTGRDGGRDIDLRRFASEGMKLYGALEDADGARLKFGSGLAAALDEADRVYNGINAAIDKFIADNAIDAPPLSTYQPVWRPGGPVASLDLADSGIGAIVWCIGFRPDFSWIGAPVFDASGQPRHRRGVTDVPGFYFLGLPWLHSWGSGRFSGIARDAGHVAEAIREARQGVSRRARAAG